MTLNKKWRNEWDNIVIPHDKINIIISNAVKEMPNKKKKNYKHRFKSPLFTFIYGVSATSIIAAGLFIFLATQSNLYNQHNYSNNEATVQNAEVASSGAELPSAENKVASERDDSSMTPIAGSKIVTEYQIVKQSNSLKKDYQKVEELINNYQGLIVNSNLNLTTTSYANPTAYMVLNVPTNKINDFLDALEKVATTTSSSVSQYDVSTEYFDNESRIKSLETEEKALLELLEKSGAVEDMIRIQERLSTIRSEREELVRGNKTFDNQIDYTLVHLTLDEEGIAKPQKNASFWKRIKISWKNQQINLKNFGENILVFLFSYGIYIFITGGLTYLIIRKIRNTLK